MKILLIHSNDLSTPHEFDWSILVSTLSGKHELRTAWWIVDEFKPDKVFPEVLPGIVLSEDVQNFEPDIILIDGRPDPQYPKIRSRKLPLKLEDELWRRGCAIVFLRAIPDINDMEENVGFVYYGYPIGLSGQGRPVRLCGPSNDRMIKIPEWPVPRVLQSPKFESVTKLDEIIVDSPWILDDRPEKITNRQFMEPLFHAPSHYDGKDPVWVYGDEIGGIRRPFVISAWRAYPGFVFLFTGDIFSDKMIKRGNNLLLFQMLIEAIPTLQKKRNLILRSQTSSTASSTTMPTTAKTEPGKTVTDDKITSAIPILFLAADPTNLSRLRLGEEFREIHEKLQLAKFRDRFRLELPQLSARPEDISQALLDLQPQIVHFSGHGASTGALCFENRSGQTHSVSPDALAALFEQFASQITCVLLNACYSEAQAHVIGKHIEYVIGMSQAISDKAAIAFAVGFYQALGAGRNIEEAYKLGCVQIQLQGVPAHLTPVLVKRDQAKPLPQDSTDLQSPIENYQPVSRMVVGLQFDKDGLVITNEQELKASLAEALFAAENQEQVTFEVRLEPLETVKRYINSLENSEVSPENRITKVNLLRQARGLEAKQKAVTLATSLLLLRPLQYHYVSVDKLIESLNGLARLSIDFQCDESANSLSLTVFRRDDPELNTVIWIDATEQEQIKTHSGSDNVFVSLAGCDLFDLPTKIRFGKAIPAIILTIAFEAIRTGQDIYKLYDLSKVLDLYSWSVGLH